METGHDRLIIKLVYFRILAGILQSIPSRHIRNDPIFHHNTSLYDLFAGKNPISLNNQVSIAQGNPPILKKVPMEIKEISAHSSLVRMPRRFIPPEKEEKNRSSLACCQA
jgi:hypothetical protein